MNRSRKQRGHREKRESDSSLCLIRCWLSDVCRLNFTLYGFASHVFQLSVITCLLLPTWLPWEPLLRIIDTPVLVYFIFIFLNNQQRFGFLQQETLCAPHHAYHCWVMWRNINNCPVRNARNVNEFQRFLPQHSWLWTSAHGLIAANTVQASLADEVKPNLNWIQDWGEMNGTSPCCLLSHRFQRLDEIIPNSASIYSCWLTWWH